VVSLASRRPVKTSRKGRIVAGAIIGLVVVLLVVAGLVMRHYSSPAYLEKRLSAALGPNYLVHIGSSHYDPLGQALDARDVSLRTNPARPAPPKDRPRTRMSVQVRGVHAGGINLWALRNRNIDIDRILLDSPKVSVLVDRFGVPLNHPRPTMALPNEVIVKSGRRIRIETIHVFDGEIRFSERSRDGVRPGLFRFEDLNATIDHLTNDASQHEHPCVIDVRTLLANAGAMKATFEYDLSSPELRMQYHATIGKMDATALNELLVNLNGIHVTEGTIDGATLDIKMNGNMATGPEKILYHGLKFEVVDKDTHDQNVSDHLTTWLQSWKTHSSNPREKEDPPTVITIQRPRQPYISLIKFVWETLREGVLRTLGAPTSS